jgi:hypothetical protein
VKFIPQPSTSPRVITARQTGAVHLELVFDPIITARRLSVGIIGAKGIRRTWLTPEQASELLVQLATLSPEWSK